MKGDYQQVEAAVKEAERNVVRSKTIMEETLRQIEEEFEVTTVKEAKKLLTQLEKKADEEVAEFERAFDEFKEQYGSVLDLDD